MKSIGGHTALVVAMEWKRELVVKVFFINPYISIREVIKAKAIKQVLDFVPDLFEFLF